MLLRNVGAQLRRRDRLPVVVAIALAVAVSCDEITTAAPMPPVWRRYALSHVDGVPVPTVLRSDWADSTWIVSETLTFRVDGQAHATQHVARGPTSNAAVSQVLVALDAYRVYGDSVQVGEEEECHALPCVPTMRKGAITELTLVLVNAAHREFRFHRVHAP